MGSDHSSLALIHNIDEIEEAIKHRKPGSGTNHGWSSAGTTGDITISSNGQTATRKSASGKKTVVKGCKPYKYGVHFFEFTWSKTTSKDLSVGIATEDTSLVSDDEILLGSDDQSVGWNLVSKNMHYNRCVIKVYPDKKPSTYVVPEKVVMILNMDQGSISFKANDENLGVAMSGLKHVSEELYVAACLSDNDDQVCVTYLGGSETEDEDDGSSDSESTDESSTQQLQFHQRCAANVDLDGSKMKATRKCPKKTFNSATVLTNRPLNDGEEFKIKIGGLDPSNWSGLLVVGVTTNKPKNIQFPTDSMMDYKVGDTWSIRMNHVNHNDQTIQDISTDLDDLQVGDIVMLVKTGQNLKVTVKGKTDQIKLGSDKDVYGFVDVYGRTTTVNLIPGNIGTVNRKRKKKVANAENIKNCISSLGELFETMKRKDSKDVKLIFDSLKYFSSMQKEQSRFKRRSAGNELAKGDRPNIITGYVEFLMSDNNDTTAKCFLSLLCTLSNYTNTSLLFCKKLGEAGLLKVLQKILQDCPDAKESFTEIILAVVYNCAQASENKARFRNNGFVGFAKRYLDTTKYNNTIVALAFFTMSYVYVKHEVSLLKLPDEIVLYTVKCLENAAKSANHTDEEGWHISELILGITNLTENSSNILSFVQHFAVNALIEVLPIDSVYDKECALNAIWSLTTDNTKDMVASTDTLIERLELLQECGHSTVEQAAKRILAKVKITILGGQVLPGTKPSSKCKFQSLCERFKTSLQLEDSFFTSQYDTCYCANCHADRGDKSIYARGEPPKDYGIPVGWCRFGLLPAPRAKPLRAFDTWHRAYHGTRKETVEHILKVGELAPAGRAVLGKGTIKELPGHYSEEGFKPEGFNTKRIFLSPSIRYSGVDTYAAPSRFKDPLTGKSHNVKVVFQVLVDPGSYEVGAETIGADHEIDPGFSNQELEWIVEAQGGTLLYGLLIKVDNSF